MFSLDILIFPRYSYKFTDIWKGLKQFFPLLPDYHSLPRSKLGRPYLAIPYQNEILQKSDLKHLAHKLNNLNSLKQKCWLIDFNLSHTENYYIIGLVTSTNNSAQLLNTKELGIKFGIDAEETIKELKLSYKNYCKRMVDENDQNYSILQYLHNSAKYEQLNSLLRCDWIIKEAIVKSLGSSIFHGKKIIYDSVNQYNIKKLISYLDLSTYQLASNSQANVINSSLCEVSSYNPVDTKEKIDTSINFLTSLPIPIELSFCCLNFALDSVCISIIESESVKVIPFTCKPITNYFNNFCLDDLTLNQNLSISRQIIKDDLVPDGKSACNIRKPVLYQAKIYCS